MPHRKMLERSDKSPKVSLHQLTSIRRVSDTIDTPHGGFAKYPNAIIRSRSVPKNAKLVLLAIFSYAGSKLQTFTSLKKIGSVLGMTPPTVREAMRWLIEAGYITVLQRKGTRYLIRVTHEAWDLSKTARSIDEKHLPQERTDYDVSSGVY